MRVPKHINYMQRKNLPRLVRDYTPVILFACDHYPTEILFESVRLQCGTVAQEIRWAANMLLANPNLLPKPHNTFALIWPLLCAKPTDNRYQTLITGKTKLDIAERALALRLKLHYPKPQPFPLVFAEPPNPDAPTPPKYLTFDEVDALCAAALSSDTPTTFHAKLTPDNIDTLESKHRGLAIIPTGLDTYKAL